MIHGYLGALLVLGAGLAPSTPTAQSGGGARYRDPAGRFSIAVPSGWNAEAQGEGVVLSRGTAMVAVAPFSGANSTQQMVGMLANQYAPRWRDLTPINNGDFTLAGRPAAYGMFSGVNPKGVPALLRLSGFASQGEGFALIQSAPQDEFNAVSGELLAIEASFALGGSGGEGRSGRVRGRGFADARVQLVLAIALCFAVSAVISFVRGQRLLNELRERFPVKYEALGRPSYLSFAIAGKSWWRPVSADNFFRLRRYAELNAPDFIERAEGVRRWYRVRQWSMYAMIAVMLIVTYVWP